MYNIKKKYLNQFELFHHIRNNETIIGKLKTKRKIKYPLNNTFISLIATWTSSI